MKNLTWQNPEQLFVAQELINKVKSKCCGIKDENNVWIKSKDLLPNVDIVIKDSANKVIYHGAMPLSPSASVIPLPDDNEKYSIELSYGKNSFSGFFE